ncbi:DUF5133 domain-containing protein [Streptomyces sp. TR06-5]|uniref:DUF5133 domain-containing protein n=1 Tax=unclassified Streptomyces TaxID=2593676 RepID=UPI00399F0926
MAHPAVLADLLEQYETLVSLGAAEGGPEARRRLHDVARSLCVATGTADVRAAAVAARYGLPGARTEDDSVLAGRRSPAAAAPEPARP